MSLKHRLPELEASIDPAALRAAADEYSDLLLTLCLCMKMAGPTRANVRACATELKKRLTTAIKSSMQFCPVGIPLAMFSASAVKRTTTRAQLAIQLMFLCEVNMRLINRSKQSPLGRQACDAALAKHVELYGDYGRQKMKRTYTVVVQGTKITVEVVNRNCSYVATAMNCARRLRHLPGQVS